MVFMDRKTKTIVKQLKVRDYLMLRVICGVTKAAVHVDHKKQVNKKTCRGKPPREE